MARPKRKQLEIAGTERRTIAEVDAAAEAYFDAKQARKEAQRHEDQALETLAAASAAHDIVEYVYVDEAGMEACVKVKRKTKISVTKSKPAPAEVVNDDEREEAA